MEGYWIIRTYKAGIVGEKIKYWVPGQKPTKSQRRMKNEIRKQQANEASAVKKVARLLNANFQGGDGFLCLTYDEKGIRKIMEGLEDMPEEEKMEHIKENAKHQLKLFFKRVAGACKRKGIELKYIAITSDMDGETGEYVRIHHHIVVPAEVVEICEAKWKLGYVRKNKVWEEPDHFGLAKYLMDQVRRVPDQKKYTPSRNLIVPEPVDRIARGGKEVQPPKGAVMIHRSEWKPGLPQYIRYIIPKDKRNNSDGNGQDGERRCE